jgi:hypothetical protein
MNLIEAIKSGKPYRAVGSQEYFSPECTYYSISKQSLLDEYEIKQEPREWNVHVSEDGAAIFNDQALHVVLMSQSYGIKNVKEIKVREIIE